MPKSSFIVQLCALLLVLHVTHGEILINKDTSGMALNFPHAVTLLNRNAQIAQSLKNQDPFEFNPIAINHFIKDTLVEFANLQNQEGSVKAGLPNVTQACLTQLLQFSGAVTKMESWALQGNFEFIFSFIMFIKEQIKNITNFSSF
jgi:hypothetical protein